jgi:GDSL-like Lipase/Acylhydrolase family
MQHPPRKLIGRRKTWLAGIALGLLGLPVATECYCRLRLGLGHPPLSMADPQIEYLFVPNQHLRRFGNRIDYNAWSMRSDDLPMQKSQSNELRVMVFGDSVINGGALTDQRDLATSILQRQLGSAMGRPVVVGNISAGSWGPPNMLAYARRFGLFQADAVVIVVSSHDYADAPTFEPVVGVNPDFPSHRPWCATWEAISRYLPRYFPVIVGKPPAVPPPTQKDVDESLGALGDLIRLAQQNGARVVLAQHLVLPELPPGYLEEGHDAIAKVARDAGVEPFDLEGKGTSPALYRDRIHPNQAGQAFIAARLLPAIREALHATK